MDRVNKNTKSEQTPKEAKEKKQVEDNKELIRYRRGVYRRGLEERYDTWDEYFQDYED